MEAKQIHDHTRLTALWCWLKKNRRYAFSPGDDPRRSMHDTDRHIIDERWKQVGECAAADVKIGNKPSDDLNEFRDAQISTIFNDCVSHIKAHQQQHWRIFTWCIVGLAAMAGFALSNPIISASLPITAIFAVICVFAGLMGIYFMNEESVQLERNRNHLDAIRACMHGYVVDIYLDNPKAGTPDKPIENRTKMKREREFVMNVSLAVWVAVTAAFPVFSVARDLLQ